MMAERPPMGIHSSDSFPPRPSNSLEAVSAPEPDPRPAKDAPAVTLTWSSLRTLATIAGVVISLLGLALTVGAYLVKITQSVATKADLAAVERRLQQRDSRNETRFVSMQRRQQRVADRRHKALLRVLRDLRTQVRDKQPTTPTPRRRRRRRR